MKFEADRKAPGPLLQEVPVADFATFRAGEEAELSGYGWVDRDRAVTRIPVERAMQLLLERGLPRTAPEPTPAPKTPEKGQ
jgi:hypothetical protein